MSASEDGMIYIWKNMEQEGSDYEASSKHKDRSDEYEFFVASTTKSDSAKTPSKKDAKSKGAKSAWAIFAPMEIVSSADLKLRKWGIMNRTIKQIILVGTLDGKVKIFHSEVPI